MVLLDLIVKSCIYGHNLEVGREGGRLYGHNLEVGREVGKLH